ncbi:MAG: hypothetical protein KIS85_06320 [Anaerolineales bacterium]|nr:hypothetical protein [Anaerolineales bacterium]
MRIEILNGYRGRHSNEYYLAPGVVVDAGEEVAKHLIETGHAAPTSKKATYTLKSGPLRKGRDRPEPDEAAAAKKAEDPQAAERAELMALDMASLETQVTAAGLKLPMLRNQKQLVNMLLKRRREAGRVAVETGEE